MSRMNAFAPHDFSFRAAIAAVLASVIVLSWWHAPNPYEQLLHTSLTFVGLAFWWVCLRRYGMTRLAFVAVTLFVLLHSVGARWMYSFVPYDEWTWRVFGVRVNEFMGWQRNQYDRLVHFGYGFLLTPALMETYAQKEPRWDYWRCARQAVMVIVISSVCYEWFEWGASLLLSPQDTESYNGQQGDVWDAHKDMLLATIGSMMAAVLLGFGHYARIYDRGQNT